MLFWAQNTFEAAFEVNFSRRWSKTNIQMALVKNNKEV